MPNLNRVFLMGNLTRQVEIKHTGGNVAVGNFGLAVNRKFKSKDGQQQEETLFIDCTAWGKTAEVMAQYLGKGDPVFVEGRLSLSQWEDKNGGGKRSKISVTVENFQFIKGGDQSGGNGQQGGERTSGRRGENIGGIDNADIPF